MARVREWAIPRLPSLGRAEYFFAVVVIGLAVVVGMASPSGQVAIQVLIVLWSALVGMMIPTIRAKRRPAGQPAESSTSTASPGWRPEAAIDGTLIDENVLRHDVASALMAIEGGIIALRCLHSGHESPEAESIAHAIETEIRRIRRLSMQRGKVTARALVGQSIEGLISLHRANGAEITCSLRTDILIAMHADDLGRSIANLLENCAVHAPGAAIEIVGEVSQSRYVLTVRDAGPGIGPALLGRVFTKGVSSRVGGGLGLYSVRSIVESSGGSVTLESTPSGTLVRLDLPLAQAPTESPPVSPGAAESAEYRLERAG